MTIESDARRRKITEDHILDDMRHDLWRLQEERERYERAVRRQVELICDFKRRCRQIAEYDKAMRHG